MSHQKANMHLNIWSDNANDDSCIHDEMKVENPILDTKLTEAYSAQIANSEAHTQWWLRDEKAD